MCGGAHCLFPSHRQHKLLHLPFVKLPLSSVPTHPNTEPTALCNAQPVPNTEPVSLCNAELLCLSSPHKIEQGLAFIDEHLELIQVINKNLLKEWMKE